jgi:hypothetical protein
MPSSGVNDVRILRINGGGHEVPHNGVIRRDLGVVRCHLLPGRSSIPRAEYAVQRSDHQRVVIAGGHGQSTNRLALHFGEGFPGRTAVIRTKYTTLIVVIESPTCRIDGRGVGWVKYDVIDHEVITVPKVSERRPGVAAVTGDKQLCRTGSQQYVGRVSGVVCQATNIAAIRTN